MTVEEKAQLLVEKAMRHSLAVALCLVITLNWCLALLDRLPSTLRKATVHVLMSACQNVHCVRCISTDLRRWYVRLSHSQ